MFLFIYIYLVISLDCRNINIRVCVCVCRYPNSYIFIWSSVCFGFLWVVVCFLFGYYHRFLVIRLAFLMFFTLYYVARLVYFIFGFEAISLALLFAVVDHSGKMHVVCL